MATKIAERRKVIKSIQKVLWKRMKERGYQDIMSFLRTSGLEDDMSFETVRRTLNDDRRPPSALSVGVIMQRLGFRNQEIIEAMQSLGDTYVYSLITPDATSSEPWEEGLLNAARKLAEASDTNITYIAEALKLVASMGRVDVAGDIARMLPPPRTRKPPLKKNISKARALEQAEGNIAAKVEKAETETGEPEETVIVAGVNRKLHL